MSIVFILLTLLASILSFLTVVITIAITRSCVAGFFITDRDLCHKLTTMTAMDCKLVGFPLFFDNERSLSLPLYFDNECKLR
jgi:hypothetical protein